MGGGGLSVGNGQLAQAADRDFGSAFVNCYTAIRRVRELKDPGTALKPLLEELRLVDALLKALETTFAGTHKTIVSLKQLEGQLQMTLRAAEEYCNPPAGGCCGLSKSKGAATRYASPTDPELHAAAKATQAYARALLLEHGYSAADYSTFADAAS